MALGYRTQAESEVVVISSDQIFRAQKVEKYRKENVFPQLLDPTATTYPTLSNSAKKRAEAVIIGPDVSANYPEDLERIIKECRDLGLPVIQN